jgi:hypothetical protein
MATLAHGVGGASTRGRLLVARTVLVLVTAAGLAVDAYVHLDLAGNYAANKTDVISQAWIFRIEAVVAILAAVAVLVRPRRWSAAFAFVVAASALAALLVYRYADLGTLGPIPAMYEPIWFTEKLISFWAELAATLSALALFLTSWLTHSPRKVAP